MHHHVEIISGILHRVEIVDRPRLILDGREFPLRSGAHILPGFTDTHLHLMGIGMMAERVDLRGARDAEECARRMSERARTLSPGTWVLGFGWNQEEWTDATPLTRALLDRTLPDHPALLKRIDSHSLVANSAALLAAGPLPETLVGGEVVRDIDGEPTGLLIDAAMTPLERATPAPTDDDRRRWIAAGVRACNRVGLTAVHDMDVEMGRLPAMISLAERGELTLRTSLFLHAQEGREYLDVGSPRTLAPNLDAVGVKLYADGALGSRGALLLEPYSDQPDTIGLPFLTPGEIVERAEPALERGFGLATHAIGDGANRNVLEAYDLLRQRSPGALLRIEHAQTVHPDDIHHFPRLDVVAAIQAVHCTSDAAMAEGRLGESRCRDRAYPWRALHDAGTTIIGGSDAPIESPDPLLGLRSSVHRTPPGGEEAWTGHQRLDRLTALASYTSRASLGLPSAFRPESYFQPGGAADIAVVEGDPFDDPDARMVLTLVGGEVVWRGE